MQLRQECLGKPSEAYESFRGGKKLESMAKRSKCLKLLVRKGGLEPPRVLPHRILNPARLPNSATFAPRVKTLLFLTRAWNMSS